MNQGLLISILSSIFTLIVGFFSWLLKTSLSQNFSNINNQLLSIIDALDSKVNKESCSIIHTKIEKVLDSNEVEHKIFSEKIHDQEIWEAKHNQSI